MSVDDSRALRLKNYVGVLQTPCGTRIEVLPKISDGPQAAPDSRRLLARMISEMIDIPARDVGEAHLQTFDAPLSEWVIGQFLQALNRLVKRGIRFDYARVEDTARYLRGQLDVPRQLRRHPSRLCEFDIRHDLFMADLPENRLLISALNQAARAALRARFDRSVHVTPPAGPPCRPSGRPPRLVHRLRPLVSGLARIGVILPVLVPGHQADGG